MARATEEGQQDSSGVFTTAGREVVERLGRCLLARPTAWTLLLVQIANIWKADKLAFRFPAGAIQVEFSGVGDRRDWLESTVSNLLSGELAAELPTLLWQKCLWAALAQTGGKLVVVAAGSEPTDKTRAVRIGLDATEWGDSKLAPQTVVLQILPASSEDYFSEFGDKIVTELEHFSCSDATLITCNREVSSFLPISPRGRTTLEDDTQERGLPLGLWAVNGESVCDLPLGRSFQKLDAQGIRRQELTFGVFRTGLLLQDKAADKSRARSVVTFTHHLKPIPSQIVWLSHGVEVVHQPSALAPQPLAFTIYRELPDDLTWDLSHTYCKTEEELTDMLEEASSDLRIALEAMVTEYNAYSPGLGCSTLGCWGGLLLTSLALAGTLAPLLGGSWAMVIGVLLGFALIWGELKFRYRKRYSIGQCLVALAEDLEATNVDKIWKKEWMTATGESYPSELDWD